MEIEYNPAFRKNFGIIWEFISNDSLKKADNFKTQLKQKIENLPSFPYKYRQSFYYNDVNTRDLIFKWLDR